MMYSVCEVGTWIVISCPVTSGIFVPKIVNILKILFQVTVDNVGDRF